MVCPHLAHITDLVREHRPPPQLHRGILLSFSQSWLLPACAWQQCSLIGSSLASAQLLAATWASLPDKHNPHKSITCGLLWLQVVALLVRLPQCITTAGADPCQKGPGQR